MADFVTFLAELVECLTRLEDSRHGVMFAVREGAGAVLGVQIAARVVSGLGLGRDTSLNLTLLFQVLLPCIFIFFSDVAVFERSTH